MRVSIKRNLWAAGAVALVSLLIAGCADRSWEGVRKRNTVAGYHQFLRDDPEREHADEARQRLAFLRVKTFPSIEGYERFVSEHPGSALIPELRSALEPTFFEHVRAMNSAAGYRDFLARYPSGSYRERVAGNLEYVENVRPDPTSANLERFVEAHPRSDFVSEASTTVELIAFRRSTNISRLGVRVDVAPNVKQAQRVRRGFASVVHTAYAAAGIDVVMIPPGEGAPEDADGWVRIDYHEAPASGVFGGTLLSHCRMRLYHSDKPEDPIWDRKFSAPADHILKGAYGRDKTVFGNSKYRFWDDFFVPVSTWAVTNSRLHEKQYLETVRSLDVHGDKAALLLERGGVDFLDVSTPAEPRVIDRYRRQSDLTRWSEVRMIDHQYTLIFGADGAELVQRTALNPERVAYWDVSEIGSVRGVARFDDNTIMLATTRGVFAVRTAQRPAMAHRLLDGDFVAVEVVHPLVYLVRSDRVEVASPKHLLRHLTGRRMALGKDFGAKRARLEGTSLYVFGKDEIVEVSIASRTRPAVVNTLPADMLGKVRDVAADGGNLYVLGERGLQITAPNGQQITDSIQVSADSRVQLHGRFAFLVGERKLEVFDMAPYYKGGDYLPASAAPVE